MRNRGLLGRLVVVAGLSALAALGARSSIAAAHEAPRALLLAAAAKGETMATTGAEPTAGVTSATKPAKSQTPSKSGDIKTDPVAFLGELAKMKGQLRVGLELYRLGAVDMARAHLKRPDDPMFKAIEPGLTVRGAPSFGPQLTELADAVAAHATLADTNKAYYKAINAINGAALIGIRKALQDPKVVLGAIERLANAASDAYAKAVVQGKVVDAYSYQDGWGYTQTAKDMLASLPDDDKTADARSKVKAALDSLKPAWPTIVPPDEIATDPQLVGSAAATIASAVAEL